MIYILFSGIFALAPPTGVKAYDTPNDRGDAITVEWLLSPDDNMIEGYEIYRSEKGKEYELVGFIGAGRTTYEDQTETGTEYTYKVAALYDSERSYSEPSPVARSEPQWFDKESVNLLIGVIVFCLIILYFIDQARRGKRLQIRKISGLDAVDEAVGRATEMGRPILYSMGIGLVDYIATIASFNILGEIAKKTGQYETPLIVPTSNPVVYTVAREIVKESYSTIGRPDLFDTDKVYFVTDSQFAYAAAVDGVMLREKPAANFFIGYFKAESLIMAETGASTGAIQIAGTDQITQLPFFVTACDFTLIGEELYAASAYISKEPLLLGAIKGEDLGKIVILSVLVVASLVGLLTKFPVLNIFR
ncbi:MAG: fibronectin type III domain-containing protein [candidate division WOR-3 bacterium]|nr:MAG: fibronectin type III domain-containing protein [candidate division WOR-3 bacterium]